MNKKISLLLPVLFIYLTLVNLSASAINGNGYKIKIQLLDPQSKTIYLYGYFGGESYLFDSAYSAKGKFELKSKTKKIEKGIYSVQTTPEQKLFDIMIDQSTQFSIITNEKNPFEHYNIQKSDENILFFEYQKAIINHLNITPFIETSPNSFLSNYTKALQEVDFQDFLKNISNETSNEYFGIDQLEQLVMFHYFDQINFKDKRLLRTPLKINIPYYFGSLFENYIEDRNTCFILLNHFLEGTIDTNNRPIDLEVQFYYLKKIMQNYLYNKPGFDTLFVYLYDHYYKPEMDQWNIFNDSDQRIYENMQARKRRTFPGHFVNTIEAYDIQKNKVNIDSVKTKYKILWLWDPDCDHCVEETPDLFEFYKQNHLRYNFEVIAISITEDYNRWKSFIEENQLFWINLSYAMGEPNYDLIDFFDLMVTPGIFLIDENNKIIARQFPIKNLKTIFEQIN
jgi:hypothetical protein